MRNFVRWLVDQGRAVRLFTTDVHDEPIMRDVVDDVRAHRPELLPSQVTAEPVSSLDQLMRQIALVETVVASRFHNVLSALKMGKPTLSVGYGPKFQALMAAMGQAEFCQSARSVDLDRLIEQFTELESRSAELRKLLLERATENARLLDHQFATLSALLFGAPGPAGITAEHERARASVMREESL
jgi:polysaccharide pyruvyl transferase WcaK-like protein